MNLSSVFPDWVAIDYACSAVLNVLRGYVAI